MFVLHVMTCDRSHYLIFIVTTHDIDLGIVSF